MCTSNNMECMSPPSPHFLAQKIKSKQVRVRIRVQVRMHRLKRVTKCIKHDMELRNLKLYMENMRILKENESLRMKATLLHQENLALLSLFKKKKFKL